MECLDSKEKLDPRVKEGTMVFQVHWAQWERTGSVDLEGMLDPSGLQDLQERQALQETEVSPVQMVCQAQRELRVNEDCQGHLVPKVWTEIWDVMESQV